jgi:hypothetical protein
MGDNNVDAVAPQIQSSKNSPGIIRMGNTHEAIARWLIQNPTASQGECAKFFGYTQAWLSCIIHSDAFQIYFRKLQDEANAVTVLDVPARLRGIAAASLDGIAAQVDHALQDGNGVLHRQFLHETAELTLKALGYGQAKTAPAPVAGSLHFHQHQHKHETVDPNVLAHARGRLLEAHAVQEASQLPAGGSGDLSTVQRLTADVSSSSSQEGTETARADLSSTSGGVS